MYIVHWARIFKYIRNPWIDSKESIPPAYVACYDNPIPTRFLAPIDCLKIPALYTKQTTWPVCTGRYLKKLDNMYIYAVESSFYENKLQENL